MANQPELTMLCLASYFKGEDFLRECKRQGCRVILLTLEKLRTEPWPKEAIDDFYYMPELAERDETIHAVSFLARTERIDRIVPLDDYDVETAAVLTKAADTLSSGS